MKRTVTINGIEFDVEFDYSPAEPEVRYFSDGSGDPGCDACVDNISMIDYEGYDWYEFFEDKLDTVEEAIWEALADE
jgi:hypothetical protein